MSRREQEALKHFERMSWIGVITMILIVSIMSIITLVGVF